MGFFKDLFKKKEEKELKEEDKIEEIVEEEIKKDKTIKVKKQPRNILKELPTIVSWFKLPFELWIHNDDPSYVLANQVLSNVPLDQLDKIKNGLELLKVYNFNEKKQTTYLQKELFRWGGESKKWSFDVGVNISDFGKDFNMGFGYDMPIFSNREINMGAIIDTDDIKDLGFYIGTSKKF
jgi:hypothetical protein